MTIIEFKNANEWHGIRSNHIGASETAALFGISPWMTKWKLFMLKSGKLEKFDDNSSMRRGRHFEPAIASYAKEEFGLVMEKVNTYATDDDCIGMGASLDYAMATPEGIVPVEIKWVERNDGWKWEGDEITQMPDYYMLQVQQQIACVGGCSGMLIAFIGGTVRRMIIPRSDVIIGEIRKNIKSFWNDIQENREPPIDFSRDADAIFDLAKNQPLRTIDLSPTSLALFENYLKANEEAKDADKRADAAKAELVKMVLDSGIGNDGKAVATYGNYKMQLTKIADNPGKEVTTDMVGTIINARKGYLKTTITKAKE